MSTYVIAEMSANHAGSLENALRLVDVAKECGANCIKLQTYTADTITLNAHTDDFLIRDGLWAGKNLYQLYQEAYTPWEWHGPIMQRADKLGIDFLSTPFDESSVDFLEKLEVNKYKVASFELNHIPLLKYIAKTQKPIILSTGMATAEEIQESVDAIYSQGNKNITLLKCSSTYPAVQRQMHLNTIADMKSRFGLPVGLSDHSMGYLSAIIAVCMGACVIEKHLCLSRDIPNPDCEFSMEPAEFTQMVEMIRQTEISLGEVHYGPTPEEKAGIFGRRSIFAAGDIQKGQPFTANNVRVVRPSSGLHPREYESLLGKKASCDIAFATPIQPDMISE